jgi:hypothetical protein
MARPVITHAICLALFGVICNIPLAYAQDSVKSYDQRWCCDWQGGVLGCDQLDGRVICKDGTLSHICRCMVPRDTGDIAPNLSDQNP